MSKKKITLSVDENVIIQTRPPLSFSKTEIPKYFLYALSQLLIRKLKRKKEDLLVIISAVVVVVGTNKDAAQGDLRRFFEILPL